MTSLFPRIRTGTAYGPGAILPVPLYGLQIFERKAGWDSTRRARRAMGSALRLRRSLIHYGARSNLHRLQKANRRNGKHGTQLLSGEPGWDSAHAAENAALRRFLNAALNPSVSKSQKQRPPQGWPLFLAETVGFEPTEHRCSTDFESAPL